MSIPLPEFFTPPGVRLRHFGDFGTSVARVCSYALFLSLALSHAPNRRSPEVAEVTSPGVRDIDSQEDRMARERWRQEGDNRPQAERDQFLVGWNQRQLQAQEEERRQNAQEAARRQQAQQPPPEVHFHVPRPSQDARSPLERMGDNVEEAMRDENDSRVSQMREAKRMQHAKELEAMRQEGLLKRLQAMNDSSYEQPARRQEGPIRVFDPSTGRWLSGSEHVIENGAAYLDGRRYS